LNLDFKSRTTKQTLRVYVLIIKLLHFLLTVNPAVKFCPSTIRCTHNTTKIQKFDRLVYHSIMNLLGVGTCNFYKWNRRCRWERMYLPLAQPYDLRHFSVWYWMFYNLCFHSRLTRLMIDSWTFKSMHLFGLIYEAWDRFWMTYYECWNSKFQTWIEGEFGLNTS
jgi:hypothetical protein